MAFNAPQGYLSLDDLRLTGGPRTNVPNAAGLVDISTNYRQNRQNGQDYAGIASETLRTKAEERNTYLNAAAGLTGEMEFNRKRLKAAEIGEANNRYLARKQAQGQSTSNWLKILGLGAGLVLSDRDTKDNVQSIDDALTKLRNLKPVTFHYKEEYSTSPERMHHGFIAQEYVEVMPDATYRNLETDKMCIDTGDLIALLVRAIQQLETKVARLESTNLLAGVS